MLHLPADFVGRPVTIGETGAAGRDPEQYYTRTTVTAGQLSTLEPSQRRSCTERRLMATPPIQDVRTAASTGSASLIGVLRVVGRGLIVVRKEGVVGCLFKVLGQQRIVGARLVMAG